MRALTPIALILLLLVASTAPSTATSIQWGPALVDVGGTDDPAIAAFAVNAGSRVTWFDGATIYTNQPPAGSTIYGFHAQDAPATVDPNRVGNIVRTFTLPSRTEAVHEVEYDLNNDRLIHPHERAYRVAVGNPIEDPTYGPTNAVLIVDAQRPDPAWIDEVDVQLSSNMDLGIQDLGLDAGTGTQFTHWSASNGLEPPNPVRDTIVLGRGASAAHFPVSNAQSSGDRPQIQQTVSSLPKGAIVAGVTMDVVMAAKADVPTDCGVQVRTWHQGAPKEDHQDIVAVGTTWSKVGLQITFADRADTVEFTLFCQRAASFTPPASAPMTLFLVEP